VKDEENIGIFNIRVRNFILKNEDYQMIKNESDLEVIEQPEISNNSPRFNNHMSFSDDKDNEDNNKTDDKINSSKDSKEDNINNTNLNNNNNNNNNTNQSKTQEKKSKPIIPKDPNSKKVDIVLANSKHPKSKLSRNSSTSSVKSDDNDVFKLLERVPQLKC